MARLPAEACQRQHPKRLTHPLQVNSMALLQLLQANSTDLLRLQHPPLEVVPNSMVHLVSPALLMDPLLPPATDHPHNSHPPHMVPLRLEVDSVLVSFTPIS